MHSLLESYLTEVKAKLGALPTKRREEEMREMRQHLLDAVWVNCEQGQTEAEATASALAEFGTSKKASESVLWSWRRDVRKSNTQCYWMIAGINTVFFAFDSFRWPKQYGSIDLCGWLCVMTLIALAVVFQRLPPRYRPAWMDRWLGTARTN